MKYLPRASVPTVFIIVYSAGVRFLSSFTLPSADGAGFLLSVLFFIEHPVKANIARTKAIITLNNFFI